MVSSFFWQRVKDSNPHIQSQSLLCYPYTNPLFVPALAGTSDIIADLRKMSREFLHFFAFSFLFFTPPSNIEHIFDFY